MRLIQAAKKLPRSARTLATTALIVGAVVAGLRLLDGSDSTFWTQVVTSALILMVFALSADLAWGYTGIFTLGHALPFGVGAYTVGLLDDRRGWESLSALLVSAVIVSMLAGFLIGLFLYAGRRPLTAVAVSLSTLALSFAAERLATGWSFLGAANGIPGVTIPAELGFEFTPGVRFFSLAITITVAVYLALRALVRSQFGLVLRAVRDDSERADFLGYRSSRVQLSVFVLSSALAGLSGGLFALHKGFVGPSLLGVGLSTQALLWLVLGGRGHLAGAVIGVAIVEVAGRKVTDEYPRQWPIILGIVLLAFVTFLPGGLIQGLARLRQLMSPRRPPDSNQPNRIEVASERS